MKHTVFFICTIFIFSFTQISCGINIFSDSDDIKLGRQLDEEIKKNPQEYPILTGYPGVNQYIVEISNSILTSPAIKKRGIYAYTYEIIHKDDMVNAFCTPGGYIYIYTGLLKFIDNEATLAGILAHEIAHAELRHATQRMTRVYGVQFLLSVILGQKPAQIAEIAANLFSGLALLANSRADEKEADEYSIKYLTSTPYYPGAITYFFDKIQREKGKRGGTLERLLSTHPLPQDRIDHVNALLRQMGNPEANETNLFTERYLKFKQTLP